MSVDLRAPPTCLAHQYRLRTELYGVGGASSTDLHLAVGSAGAIDEDSQRNTSHASRCYGARGYGGRGYSHAGRGYARTGSGSHGSGSGGNASGSTRDSRHSSSGGARGFWGWGPSMSRSQGDAAAKMAAAKADAERMRTGVMRQREATRAQAVDKFRNAGLDKVKSTTRTPGSTGRHPGRAYAPAGSHGHASSGGYSG